MTTLFRRKCIVTVGTIQIRDLDVTFTIEKSLKREPNKCDLAIYNLNDDHRLQLAQQKVVPVKVEAGYEEQTSLIFAGDLRSAHSTRDGADIITKLSSGDGEHKLRSTRINKSFAKGTSVHTVLEEAAKALGVGLGNAVEAFKKKGLQGVGDIFSGGTVLSGNAANEVDGLAKSAGLEWSVQDGNLQILERGRALEGVAVRLAPSTGLVGSPTIDNKGLIRATCLMIPDVFPGRQVSIESEAVRGVYRVDRCVYNGDTFGTEWTIQLECKAPK
jgi:hypothetical protein